jgi:hypothetical protein
MYGEYEQDLFEDKRIAAVGGEYRLDSKTRVYLRHEFISSLGGPFEINTVQRQNTTVYGIESSYAKDATFFNEYRARDGFSGREAEAAIGLRNAWTLAEGLRASTTFERIVPLEGATSNTNDSTAVTGALEYTPDPDWKGTTRLELRTSNSVDSLLETIGVAYKLNDDWTTLAKSVVYLAENKGPGAVDQTQARVQAGLAWRPTRTDVWNALGKYEFRIENGAPGVFDGGSLTTPGDVHRRVNIVSLDVNYQPEADWQMSGHYAGKLAFDDSSDHNDMTSAHLVIGRFSHDLTKRLDIGFGASALVSPNGRSLQYGIGPELGFTLTDNLRVAVGYNLRGFTDQDLTAEQYTAQGVYFALRLKFDEALFRRRKDGDHQP